ncbi:MAG TPA: hypothetical protein VK689_03510, partial [Armatimonadota bacterium]|nr:hypothetical protein [Armatimonadota bacterium]
MTRPIQSLVRRRWPLLILTGTLVSGATVGALRVQALVRAQLPQLLSAQLESALGRPVHFGRVHVGLMGVWVDDLRVPRIAGEPADPLSAKRLRVAADWWRLLTTRQLQVQGVDLDGARVRLAAMPRKQDEQPWTAQVLRLSATGIERFGVHNASVEMLPTRGQSGAWTATGVGGDLRVRADEFTYGARLAHFSSADLSLQGVSLAGTGSASGLHLRDARATYHGVEVQASGDVRNRGNAVAMTLRVRKAPLSKLAAQLGIPAKWAVDGNITGAFTVDARNNDLHAIRGTLTVNRGSLTRNGGKFPWTTARADLEWTPAKAVLRNLRLSGKGLSVTAEGSITTAKGQPMTAGRFALTGDVVANESGAVAQVAELLAFRRVLDGRWQAARAALHFRAGGTVGDLAASTATGRLHLDGLRFRPMPTPDSVTVHSLDAELERTPTQLVLRGVRARTEGLSLAAEVSLTDDRPGAPGQFRVSGSVGAKDLKSLRTAIPHAELWQWIPVASPAANGSVQFTLGGPTANPAATWSRGRFQVSDFRLSAHSSLPSSAMFFIPVKVASGAFRQADGKLAFDDVQIAAQTFNARGRAGFDFTGP